MGEFTENLNRKFGSVTKTEVSHCPRCSNETSKGFLMQEDVFCDVGEVEGVWLRYAKCVNCSWRMEIGNWRTVRRKRRIA